MLSGFVFFWLYAEKIRERAVSVREFFVFRLSRLYPLHFVTLVFVAVAQIIYEQMAGKFFVYSENNFANFLLNLVFASSWGFANGSSFNGPIWSVSIEVLVYCIFYLYCLVFRANIVLVLIISLLGMFVVPFYDVNIGTGIQCFFLGAVCFILFQKIAQSKKYKAMSLWLPIITGLAWLSVFVFSNPVLQAEQQSRIDPGLIYLWSMFCLFPMTIISLALSEVRYAKFWVKLSFLGNISYSSYLIHFPLQITAAIFILLFSISPLVFFTPVFMTTFFALLIGISYCSHRFFEVPIQRYLRNRLLRVNLTLPKPA